MNDAKPQYNVHERPAVRYRYVTSWLFAFLKEQINLFLYDGEQVLHSGINASDKDFLAAVGESQRKWTATRKAFLHMAALRRSRDIPFLVVIFPSYNKPFTRRYPFRSIYREVAGWAEREKVQGVDFLEYMKNKDNRAYRIEGDGHPNAGVFEEAAAILAPVIAESLATGGVL